MTFTWFPNQIQISLTQTHLVIILSIIQRDRGPLKYLFQVFIFHQQLYDDI
jgi:hypothetical protein